MFGHSMVCTVIKTLLELCPFFSCFLFVCLFVCFLFYIFFRFSGPLTASITGIQVYVSYDKDPKPIKLCGCFVLSCSCRFVLITQIACKFQVFLFLTLLKSGFNAVRSHITKTLIQSNLHMRPPLVKDHHP